MKEFNELKDIFDYKYSKNNTNRTFTFLVDDNELCWYDIFPDNVIERYSLDSIENNYKSYENFITSEICYRLNKILAKTQYFKTDVYYYDLDDELVTINNYEINREYKIICYKKKGRYFINVYVGINLNVQFDEYYCDEVLYSE